MAFLARLSRMARRFQMRRKPGYIDHFDAKRVAGWAYDPQDPTRPALLTLQVDGRPELNILADIPRDDVVAAGLGPRRCGFDVALPARLRDGHSHEVELRLGSTGPVLKRITIAGEGGTALSDPAVQSSQDGVAFLDAAGGAIAGWAMGCTGVIVRFDDGSVHRLGLSRIVPGLGSGAVQGFWLPIPASLRDGQPHLAQVVFDLAHSPEAKAKEGAALDNAPVPFTLSPTQPVIEVIALDGLDLQLRLHDPDNMLPEGEVTLAADGKILPHHAEGGHVSVRLPGPCHLLILDGLGEVLARYDIRGPQIRPAPRPALPAHILTAPVLAQARAAFAQFCARPDARFDPLWYRWANSGAHDRDQPQALITHYRDFGARAGIGLNPMFDEAGLRASYPELARAVAEGHLPCVFALDLALSAEGGLRGLPGLGTRMGTGLGPDVPDPDFPDADLAPSPAPLPIRLPVATQGQRASTSLYAAWLARLDTTDALRAEIAEDEQRLRYHLLNTALTRAPLVSIIMPSWNRAFTIGEAIQSVLEQSYANWELIICDDASEDRTSDVVRSFDDPRIRYMKFQKSNGAGARNKGLAHARGEFIAYLDSDNIWHPLFLDMMLRALLANPGTRMAYSAYLDTEIVGARVRLDKISRQPFRPVPLAERNYIDLNTILHHRDLRAWLGQFDTRLPRLQDWDLVLRYTSIFRPIFVDHIGVFYRRNIAWGQVTHLFMGSGAQDSVNEKTRRRLDGHYERLKIAWPGTYAPQTAARAGRARAAVTILCSSPEGQATDLATRLLAENLAGLAADIVDVDLVVATGAGGPARPAIAGMRLHEVDPALWRNPAHLAHALGGVLQGRPVLAGGTGRDYLRCLDGLDPRLVWQLRRGPEGSVLQALDQSRIQFDLGAVPLSLPVVTGDGTDHGTGKTRLPRPVLALAPARAHAALRMAAQREGLSLLFPPDATGLWRLSGASDQKGLDPDPVTGLPVALADVAVVISMTTVPEMDPFTMALVNALQARGVAVALPSEQGRARPTGMGRQWIVAGAAYEIAVNEPDWILEKTRKLLADGPTMDRLSVRSRHVHAIVWHPDLVRERLAHALYRILHDTPQREVIDGRS